MSTMNTALRCVSYKTVSSHHGQTALASSQRHYYTEKHSSSVQSRQFLNSADNATLYMIIDVWICRNAVTLSAFCLSPSPLVLINRQILVKYDVRVCCQSDDKGPTINKTELTFYMTQNWNPTLRVKVVLDNSDVSSDCSTVLLESCSSITHTISTVNYS